MEFLEGFDLSATQIIPVVIAVVAVIIGAKIVKGAFKLALIAAGVVGILLYLGVI